jgi:hypothetical protein
MNSSGVILSIVHSPFLIRAVKPGRDEAYMTHLRSSGCSVVTRYGEINNPRVAIVGEGERDWNVDMSAAASVLPADATTESTTGVQVSETWGRIAKPGQHLTAPILYAVRFSVPEARQSAFDEWYDVEHVPMVQKCADWLLTRRYKIVLGNADETRLALHYLGNITAVQSDAVKAARKTPWRHEFAQEPWFKSAQYALYLRDF